MFTYIKFKNFKSLVDVELNLKNKNKINKLNIIYGENGAGKSNVASAFYALTEFNETMSAFKFIKSAIEKLNNEEDADDIFDNAKHDDEKIKRLIDRLKDGYRDTQDIIKNVKTIASKENMSLEYGFKINGFNGSYYIETDNESIVHEKLYYKLEKNRGCYFEIYPEKNIFKLNEKVFIDKDYLDYMYKKIDEYWGKHTLISIINNDIENKTKRYYNEKISDNFKEVLQFLSYFSCTCKEGTRIERGSLNSDRKIMFNLKSGKMDFNDDNEKELEEIEDILNSIFTGLYSDIKNVYYKKEIEDDKISYHLYLKKLINNKVLDINFNRESTGTMRILDILPAILHAIRGNVSIIDEFDSGIHDLMVRDILKEVNRNMEGQLILTTHNTLLLEEKEFLKNIYFIVIDGRGRKHILNIGDYDNRTHPNHNARDLYLKGMYQAVPNTGNFDLEEVKQKLL